MALIICCSPAASDAAETLSSLRFGARAKGIMTSLQVLEAMPFPWQAYSAGLGTLLPVSQPASHADKQCKISHQPSECQSAQQLSKDLRRQGLLTS